MTIFNAVIVVVATALMQWHGIQFWSDVAGVRTGWMWSVTLEASALWLWARAGKYEPMALAASALLLAGPLFHIASPMLLHSKQVALDDAARNAQISLLRDEIATLERSLATALENSQRRPGWLNDIQANRAGLSDARKRIAELTTQRRAQHSAAPYIQAAMQALALLVVWGVSVMAVRSIVEYRRESIVDPPVVVNAAPVSRPPSINDRAPPRDDMAATEPTQRISEALDAVLRDRNISQAQWAREHGLLPKDVSIVRNHRRRISEGKPGASRKKIAAMAQLLGIELTTEQIDWERT